MNNREPPRPVLVISSFVADGSVGGRVSSFALQRLGLSVQFVPTVTMPCHPRRAPGHISKCSGESLESQLSDLLRISETEGFSAVLSGYFGHPDQVPVVAQFVARAKILNPELTYLCDPVMGDHSGLYIDQKIAEQIRELLVPIADVITPNLFELSWLGNVDQPVKPQKLVDASKKLSRGHTLITSVPGLMENHIGNLLITDKEAPILFEHTAVPHAPHGTGDLLAALYLAHRLLGQTTAESAGKATSSVFELTVRAAKLGFDDLPFISDQMSLERPVAMIKRRNIGHAASGVVRKSGHRPVFKPTGM